MTNNSKTSNASDINSIDNNEKEELQNNKNDYIKELEAEIAALKIKKDLSTIQDQDYAPEFTISQDDYIKVISLCSDGWRLNLSTLGGGNGRVYKFSKFGEQRNIRYGDLNDIVEAHRNLLEAGRFYILNKKVIRHLGLDDIYSKIITKENILNILEGVEDSVEIYKSCNTKQQEMIISMISEKLRDDPNSVDLNVVDKISKVSGVKIAERAEDSRKLKEEAAQPV